MPCRLGVGEGAVGKTQGLVDPTEHPHVVDLSEEEWDRIFAVNVKGCYLTMKHGATLQFFLRDTRDRHLARSQPDAEALRRQGARGKRHARRRARSPGR